MFTGTEAYWIKSGRIIEVGMVEDVLSFLYRISLDWKTDRETH
jgi:hypothetical protein